MKTAVRLIVSGTSVALAIVPWIVAWSSLPNPMASHWTFGTVPDGYAPRLLLFGLLAGLVVVFAVGGVTYSRHEPGFLRLGAAGPGMAFASAAVATLSLAVVVANRNAASWKAARLPNAWIAAALAAGALAGIVTSRTMPTIDDTRVVPRPTTPVGRTERLAWVGHARGQVWILVALGTVAIGVVVMLTASIPAGLVVIASAILVMAYSSVEVLAGAAGVRIRGPFGLPRVVIPLARIEGAEAIHVEPMQWGGWGYRGGLVVFRRAAWVVRRGEGLKLDLSDGKVFVVTVDHAGEAAAMLNGLKGQST